MEVSFHPERVKAGGGWREVGENLIVPQAGGSDPNQGREGSLSPSTGREIHKLDVGSELEESKSFLFLLSFLRVLVHQVYAFRVICPVQTD